MKEQNMAANDVSTITKYMTTLFTIPLAFSYYVDEC